MLTLPGDTPTLLRRCSPVIYRGARCVVILDPWMDGDVLRVQIAGDVTGTIAVSAADVGLDLDDPTGRAQAAQWLFRQHRRAFINVERDYSLVRAAQDGAMLDREDIATLRALCLRLAGRT
jgi:hypothetical protein